MHTECTSCDGVGSHVEPRDDEFGGREHVECADCLGGGLMTDCSSCEQPAALVELEESNSDYRCRSCRSNADTLPAPVEAA